MMLCNLLEFYQRFGERFEVFTAMTTKNAVFWNITACCSCKDRRFGRTYRLHHQEEKNQRARNVNSY
jgi:hypothetical protein